MPVRVRAGVGFGYAKSPLGRVLRGASWAWRAKRYRNARATDPHGLWPIQLITAHIDEDEFCRYVIQRDINGIALALRETHKDDFFSVPEDNPLKEMLETAGEIVSQDSDTEQAYLAFICKRLKLNFRKLSVEERKWLKKIAEKSDLLKNPKPQRGRR